MTITPVLGLRKPDASDAVKRADFNYNWDLLDAHKHDLANLTGITPVANGGTGADNATAARTNIGADDAANLTKGTLPIARLPITPITKGGTGADNAVGARANLGAASTDPATQSTPGLMSVADKIKLDGVAAGANNYNHPNSGVSAGTYRKVTVNAQGHITAANNDPAAITDGGTGSNTAAGARTNLGVPPTLHTDDVGAYGKASAEAYGHAMASSKSPLAPGTAAVGADNGKFAREDHVHPAQSSVTGNAGTATKLAAPRMINGTPFDGSEDISFGTLMPQLIPVSEDMNNITTPGAYYCTTNATAESLQNCPTTQAFFLFVGIHAGVSQVVVERTAAVPKVYLRNNNGTWGDWCRIYTTADAPTSVSGNAGTATKLATARAISVTGGATAAGVNFDGTGAITLNVTALDVSKATAGTLPIARGGTGATDAATARTNLGINLANLGAAASNHTHALTDAAITGTLPVARGGTGQTSLQALRNAAGLGNTTGALPVANGGTGATTAAQAIANLGYASNIVIYSDTEPGVVPGKLWLKPIA